MMISYEITYRFGILSRILKNKIAINVICQLVRKFRLLRKEECTSELFLYYLPKRIYIYICVYRVSSTWLMFNVEFYQVLSNNFLFQRFCISKHRELIIFIQSVFDMYRVKMNIEIYINIIE